MRSSVKKRMRRYWESHPIGVEAIEEEVGSPEFYRKYLDYYDQFYDYKWKTFEYEKYRGRKVLEIGCGLGIDSYKFAKWGAELTCIDLAQTSVRNTKRLLEQLGLRADVLQGDVEALAFPDESFDVVYAYGVLMLAENEPQAYDEIYRVLKEGGEALVVLYHRRSWFWLLKNLSGTEVESEAGDPPVNRVHSLQEVAELFKRFSRVETRLERFPQQTRRRRGIMAFAFNWVFVPLTRIIPRGLMRPFGWHIVVKAVK
ncbi:MAG: class I SAM-dependent methyltransferase [Thermoanaerobaculia bacterium]